MTSLLLPRMFATAAVACRRALLEALKGRTSTELAEEVQKFSTACVRETVCVCSNYPRWEVPNMKISAKRDELVTMVCNVCADCGTPPASRGSPPHPGPGSPGGQKKNFSPTSVTIRVRRGAFAIRRSHRNSQERSATPSGLTCLGRLGPQSVGLPFVGFLLDDSWRWLRSTIFTRRSLNLFHSTPCTGSGLVWLRSLTCITL